MLWDFLLVKQVLAGSANHMLRVFPTSDDVTGRNFPNLKTSAEVALVISVCNMQQSMGLAFRPI